MKARINQKHWSIKSEWYCEVYEKVRSCRNVMRGRKEVKKDD